MNTDLYRLPSTAWVVKSRWLRLVGCEATGEKDLESDHLEHQYGDGRISLIYTDVPETLDCF